MAWFVILIHKILKETNMTNWKLLTERRIFYNNKLLQILSKLVERYPEQRMGQILYNFGFVTRKEDHCWKLFDPFNEEPNTTYDRVVEILKKSDMYDEIVNQ